MKSYHRYCDILQGDSPYIIYGLCSPKGKIIRYVGLTTNLYARVMIHVSDGKHLYKNTKEQWLFSLRGRPKIVILAKCENEFVAKGIEKHMISFYKSRFLLNAQK